MRSNNFELSPDRSSFVIRCDYPVQEYKESGRIEVVVSYLFLPSVAGPLHRHSLKMDYYLKFCISSRCLICLSSSPLLMRPIEIKRDKSFRDKSFIKKKHLAVRRLNYVYNTQVIIKMDLKTIIIEMYNLIKTFHIG